MMWLALAAVTLAAAIGFNVLALAIQHFPPIGSGRAASVAAQLERSKGSQLADRALIRS